MVKAKVLAFLLCDNATKDHDGKVTLHGLFDRLIAPRNRRDVKTFFVYCRVVVVEPFTVTLKVTDPHGNKIPRDYWRDSLTEIGPIQTIWALSSNLFEYRGHYKLELMQEDEDSEPLSLAEMRLTLEESEESSQ
jgi:hypothetical protein